MAEAGIEKKVAAREAMLAGLDMIRKDLEGPNPSALEGLLCSRVATCWLAGHLADMKLA